MSLLKKDMKKLLLLFLGCVSMNFSTAQTPILKNGLNFKSIPALKIDKPNLIEKLEISSGFFIDVNFTPINQVWWTTFEKLDQQHKGYLIRADFRPYWIMWIASWKYFSIIDTNKDGQISKEEMQHFIDKEETNQRKKFVVAWERFDIDKDGFISREEARESTFLDTRFDATDINKDGLLSPQEVINAYAKELAGFV